MTDKPMLSEQTKARFDREVAKYPADQKQSAVMACLSIAQQEQGWVSPEAEAGIADYLGMPAIAVREVTTFYNMYNLKPVGKYKLAVCTCIPCALSGGRDAAAGGGLAVGGVLARLLLLLPLRLSVLLGLLVGAGCVLLAGVLELRVGGRTCVPHAPQNTPLHGLQPIAHIRKRTISDN